MSLVTSMLLTSQMAILHYFPVGQRFAWTLVIMKQRLAISLFLALFCFLCLEFTV